MSTLDSAAKGTERLTEPETRLARQASEQIAGFIRQGEPPRLTLSYATGEPLEATVPAQALHLLVSLLRELASGNPVAVVALDAEITARQAAAMIRSSPSHLNKLLDSGRIPF